MAYQIKFINSCETVEVSNRFYTALDMSNFKITGLHCFKPTKRYQGGMINIIEVRNKWSRFATGKATHCLRPLDWVRFNDFVNDFLDDQGIIADVSSSRCIVRKGAERRHYYEYRESRGWDYDASIYDHAYHNGIGKISFRSTFNSEFFDES